ncbi:hypothetical protein HYV84_01700 [Candidatus Woesearchaeota archaeon]|nr:hypothetical protein [Candidatus Woesearchaeota archaeon]
MATIRRFQKNSYLVSTYETSGPVEDFGPEEKMKTGRNMKGIGKKTLAFGLVASAILIMAAFAIGEEVTSPAEKFGGVQGMPMPGMGGMMGGQTGMPMGGGNPMGMGTDGSMESHHKKMDATMGSHHKEMGAMHEGTGIDMDEMHGQMGESCHDAAA